eukprot:Nk52_evm54s32 gene=Nk52_evmTU54s32
MSNSGDSFSIPSVLVTGANRGIGLEFVKSFLKMCLPASPVFACCRNPDEATELIELKEGHGNLHILKMDVTNDQDIVDCVAQVEEIVQEEGLYLLVNNAGILSRSTLEETTVEEMMNVYRVDAVAPLMVVKEFLPLLRRSANDKTDTDLKQTTIVNVTSKIGSVADNGSGGRYPYRGAKSGLNNLTKSLSVDLKKDNIAAVVLHPGWVRTRMAPTGKIDTETSVEGMINVIKNLDIEGSGSFYNYDGTIIPW